MDLTHLHLLLNHVPTVGMVIALGLFLLSLIARSDHILQASLALFLGIALLTIPTYVTGNAAAQAICKAPTSTGPCRATTTIQGYLSEGRDRDTSVWRGEQV